MTRIAALTGRELRGYLLSPVGYVVLGLFLAFTGLLFSFGALENGQPASMRSVFNIGTWLLLFVCPAIAMRSIAEEKRLGTFEMLMTSPVREGEVVLGKFLGGLAFLLVMLVPTLLCVLALELYGRPDYGEVLCGYMGLILAGAAYLASGLFASAITSSQIVAFLLAFFFWAFLGLAAKLLPQYLNDPWLSLVFAADPDPRLRDFAIGLIDSSNVAYFLSFTIFFLFASTAALGARRWR